jgi:hypothetical protein
MTIEQSVIRKIHSQETPIVIEGAVNQAKYIIAILDSCLGRWFLLQKKAIPIPKIPAAGQQPFIRLVDEILEAKSTNPEADTSELEEAIDWLVYGLYDLTDEETAVVADFFWDGLLTEEEEDKALLRAMEEADLNDRVSLDEVLEILRSPDEG